MPASSPNLPQLLFFAREGARPLPGGFSPWNAFFPFHSSPGGRANRCRIAATAGSRAFQGPESRTYRYRRHLFQADEMLGPILLSHHNLTYYQRLLADARAAIAEDRFVSFYNFRLAGKLVIMGKNFL